MKVFYATMALQGLAAKDSTISKVIGLLEELEGKVQTDLKKEGELMLDFEKWCDTSKTEADYAINDDNRIISEQSALLDAATGMIEASTAAIDEAMAKIGTASTEKANAEKVREDEKKIFVAKEKELVEAGDMLVRAHQILKRSLTTGLSFAQGGQQKIEEIVSALSAIVTAAAVFEPSQIAKVKSFADESSDLKLNLAQAPQATVSAYESKSGGILKSIADLRDNTSDELRKTRNAEINSKHAHELLVQSLTNELESLNKMLSTSKATLAKAKTDKGAAEKKLAQTQDELASDMKYLDSVVHDCEAKFAAWKEHQATASDEMTALKEAREILSKKVVVLAQVSMKVRREDSDKRDRVISILRTLGRKFNSFGLLQAASSAQADPFEKVRGLITDMIAKLEKQAKEEMTKKMQCDKDIAEATKKLATKNAALDKYNARFNSATARSNKLAAEIKELQTEIKELNSQLAEATSTRNKESAENKKVIDDNSASAAAVGEAIAVLQKFYGDKGDTAFLQQEPEEFRNVASRATAPQFDFAAKRAGATHSILGVLETAQADFTALELKTKSDEEAAAANYVTYKQNTEVAIAKKEALVVGKKSEKQSLKVQIEQVKSDIDGTTTERDAVKATLDSRTEECANKAMSYEERVQRREAEITGLKSALEILSEDAMATSFLQKRFA